MGFNFDLAGSEGFPLERDSGSDNISKRTFRVTEWGFLAYCIALFPQNVLNGMHMIGNATGAINEVAIGFKDRAAAELTAFVRGRKRLPASMITRKGRHDLARKMGFVL